jgi:hypothetical protein
VFAVRNEQDLGKFGNRFIGGTSIGYAYGIHHDTEDFTFMSRFARARQPAPGAKCSSAIAARGGHKYSRHFCG